MYLLRKEKLCACRQGATAVDFAYAVHTDIGNSCVAAKIDRQLAPLSSPLVSGQTVEILTNSRAQPNPAWLDFVVTRQARNSIRQFLKNQRKVECIALGEKLLKQALKQHSLSLKKIPADILQFVLAESQLSSINELFAEIGLGNQFAGFSGQTNCRFSDCNASMRRRKICSRRLIDP